MTRLTETVRWEKVHKMPEGWMAMESGIVGSEEEVRLLEGWAARQTGTVGLMEELRLLMSRR